MSLIKQAKAGVFWTFVQQFSVQLINFSVQIVLARILLPSDFGLIAMIAVFVALGQTLSDSGMTSSLIRNNENTENDYGTVFLTNLGVSTFLYGICYAIAPLVADFYKQEILADLLRVYALVFIISAFNVVQLARFSKELDFKSQFTYQLPSVVIGAITGIVMAYFGFGVWSLIGLNVAQSLVFSVSLWIFYKWRPKFIFDSSIFKFHFSYGYKLTLSGILNTLYLNLYKIIIGKKFSASQVGFFSQADSLRLFPVNQLNTVLNKVTFPLFSKIKDDDEKLKLAYISSTRLVLSCSSVMMTILILIAEPLFLIVFGEKWLPSVPYFQILCLASVFLPFSSYNLNILKVKGRSDLFLKVEVIKKIIGVISLLVCIPFGIEAIVWSLCLTNILFAYINGFFSGRLLNYNVYSQVKHSLAIIIVAFIPFLAVYYLNSIYGNMIVGNWFKLFFLSVSYCILYLPLLFIFNKALLIDIKRIIKR